jgi:hypothetical protein
MQPNPPSFRILHSSCSGHILQMSDAVRHAICVVICASHGQRPRYQEATGKPGDYAIRIDACCETLLDEVAAIIARVFPAPVHHAQNALPPALLAAAGLRRA